MKQYRLLYSLVTALALSFCITACSPDKYDLGEIDLTEDDLVEGIAYTITHDADNPNIIYLKSLLPSNYAILWDHPQGRSQAAEVTLEIAFAGTYEARIGVQTRGGIVYGPYTTFTIDDFCSDFVDDPLWAALTGGVGNSKKWYLDIDAEAKCRYFVGPLYFYGTDDTWDTVTGGETSDGDSWSWAADWAGNGSWLFGSTGAMDYGSMTFSLEDGATVTVEDNAHGRTQRGTFTMDATNHTMKLTDAELLHDPDRDAIVTQWGTITILAMTENYMQLAVLRDNSDEGNCLLSYNFISEDYKNYYDNNVVEEMPSVSLASDWRNYVEPKTSKEMTFRLSEENPFDWADLYGSNKGITYETAVSGIEDLTLVMHSGTNAYTVTTPDGTSVTGTYSLTDDGVYTFNNGLPEVQLSESGNMVFAANGDNTLRILSFETDDYSGALTDLWVGADDIDDQGNTYQYKAYHFCPVTAGSSETRYTANINFFDTSWNFINGDNVYITSSGYYTFTINGASDSPYGIYLDVLKVLADYPNMDMTVTDIKVDGQSIDFDDTAIDRCAGDAATTARRYILNPWGATADGAYKYVFSEKIEVTLYVELSDTGTPYVSE